MSRPILPSSMLLAAALLLPGAIDASDAAEAAFQDGLAAARAGRNEDALQALNRAAELRPGHVETWIELGRVQSRLERWDESIGSYRRALEIAPDSSIAWHNLGNVQFRMGDFEAAADSYGRAVAIDPSYLLATFHHGWTLRQLNRTEEAERAFRHCLELPATDDRDRKTLTDCLFGLGSILHRKGDYASSAEAMERVLKIFPYHPEARYYLGMAYRQLGRPDEAREQLEQHRQLMAKLRSESPIEAPDEP